MTLRLTSAHRYPVKSCRGESLDAAAVEPWGLAGDRRWMVVDPDGAFVTAREARRLLTVVPGITATGLHLSAPGAGSVEVPTPNPADQQPVKIWRSRLTAATTDAGSAWLSDLLERPVHLVHLDDPTRRATSATYSERGDRVSFADGYPVMVATEASLAALNAALDEPVAMHRFRPNLVVAGGEPWAEDAWRRVRIGDATFRAVKGCARCVMVTLEPDHVTGSVTGGKEPTRTLSQLRRFGRNVWFGVNLIPDTPGAVLRPGDPVEILSAAPAGTSPLGS